jgi:CubicO group peptidase (beta-lactamase class C family)
MLIASLVVTGLAACAAQRGREGAAARPPSVAGPAEAACAAHRRLTAGEGGEPGPSGGPLRFSAAGEQFRRAGDFGFSGGVRLLEHGRVRLSRAFGFADHVRRIPMGEAAVFDIGSVAKQFTAAAILRLEELGRLRTEDPIGGLLPGVPQDKSSITVHQLLTHQAGLRHSIASLARTPPRDEAVSEMLATELIHPPGARYAYSNVGYALLAAIADRLSPNGYEAFLRDELWLPLGMRSTGMVLPDWSRAQIADGQDFAGTLSPRVAGEWDTSGPTWLTRGAGAMSSTMSDLARWAEALRSGAVLSDRSRRKLFWPHVRMSARRPLHYGYGWAIGSAADGSCVINHNGGGGVHYDVLAIFPDQGAVAVAFNTQQGTPWSAGDNFVETLTPVLTGAPLALPETERRVAPASLAGVYALPSGERLSVVSESGRLKLPMDGVAAMRLFAPWPAAAPHPGRSALIDEVMSGIAAGDYRPLLSRLGPETAAEAETGFWRDYWPRLVSRLGAYREARPVAEVVVDGVPRTIVRLSFARGATVVAFVHGANGSLFVDVVPRSYFPEAYLAPAAAGGFLAYYPTTRRSIPVRFEGGRMRIGEGEGAVVAQRTGGRGH